MKYQGSCHCGDVAFEVETDIQGLFDCNCSICSRKGILMWFVPRSALKLLKGEDSLASYKFGKGAIDHRFCKRCGIHPFGEGIAPDGKPSAAINVRCLEGFDYTTLPVTHFDGKSL